MKEEKAVVTTHHTEEETTYTPLAVSSSTPLPFVTVAICTRDRPSSLERCLRSTEDLQYPHFEVLVVDNAPTTAVTRDVVLRFPHVRYAVEPCPGLNWARNRAVREARGEIIAFADDDVVVEPDWLNVLVATFHTYNAGCVTGNVLPYETTTEAQVLFEKYGGFSRGSQRRVSGDKGHGMSFPVSSHLFGTGANMAFRTAIFETMGFFDEALDAGTVTGGGGDLEIFMRVIKAGYPLIYEPAARVRHVHRRDYAALRRQLRNHGIAYYAYQTAAFLRYPEERFRIVRFGLWWWLYWDIGRLLHTLRHPGSFPLDLIFVETVGAIRGPFAYFKARRHVRELLKNASLNPPGGWLDGEA